jgi:Na+/pantothenate symporter
MLLIQDLVLVIEVVIKLWLDIVAATGGIKNNIGGLHNIEVR